MKYSPMDLKNEEILKLINLDVLIHTSKSSNHRALEGKIIKVNFTNTYSILPFSILFNSNTDVFRFELFDINKIEII